MRRLAAALLVLLSCAQRGEPNAWFEDGVIRVNGLDSRRLARLRGDCASVLTVHSTDAAAMLGTCEVVDDVVRFTPRFPLQRGLPYRVRIDDLQWTVIDPKPAHAATVVAAIHPSSDVLPANQLKFYVDFSAPMSIGEAYRRVHLLDEDGHGEVPRAFLRIDEELWDADRRRFTLILDPGRIKRGLRANVEEGAPLREGGRYRLVIDAAWSDGDGNPLSASFEKSFRVAAPDRTTPDPRGWTIEAAVAGTRDALTIDFHEPLDRAVLEESLFILDANGRRIEGRAAITAGDAQWRFVPQNRWSDGPHALEIRTTIEDLAGNNLRRPFDQDLRVAAPQRADEWIRLPLPPSRRGA